MTDIIVLAVIGVMLGGAIAYIVKKKKSGAACIGCPYSKDCSGSCK